jgi:RNA polymerase sigma factor (sigma-70 family)
LTDWKEKTLACWETINRMAIRRFGEGVVAEEAALAVIEGLRADNWRRVRAYNEKATFVTFVRTLTARLLEDFSRQRFGRLRPPLWVKTFGGIWAKLFTALCLERLPLGEAVELVLQRQAAAQKSEIEAAASHLLARIPDCGMHQGLEVAFDEEKSTEGGQDKSLNHAHPIEDQQKKELFAAIFQLVLGETELQVSDTLLEKLNRLEIKLSAEEKLLVKLCYQEGLGVAQAGEMLGMSRFQAHGKKRRLMTRLKEEFERTGLAEELRPLLLL